MKNEISENERQGFVALTAVTLFCVLMPIYFTAGDNHWSRSALYLIPIIPVFGMLARGHLSVNKRLAALMLLFASLYGVKALSGSDVSAKEFVFVLLSILAFALPYSTPAAFPRLLMLAGTVYLGISWFIAELGSFELISGGRGAFETSFGLSLPLLLIVFYLQRRPVLFFFTTIIAFFMFKRIGLLAAGFCILFDYTCSHFIPRRLQRFTRVALVTIILTFSTAFALQSPIAFETLSKTAELFGTYSSPNAMSSGRYNATLSFLGFAYTDRTIYQWLVGDGAGSASTYVRLLPEFEGTYLLLHNDYLRILTDYGLIGLFIMLFGLFSAARSQNKIVSLCALYTGLVFVTDNVATYLYYWITVAFLLKMAPKLPAENRPVTFD